MSWLCLHLPDLQALQGLQVRILSHLHLSLIHIYIIDIFILWQTYLSVKCAINYHITTSWILTTACQDVYKRQGSHIAKLPLILHPYWNIGIHLPVSVCIFCQDTEVLLEAIGNRRCLLYTSHSFKNTASHALFLKHTHSLDSGSGRWAHHLLELARMLDRKSVV